MAINVINRKERFATEGIRFQRLNPDGTIPRKDRVLGFANTVDLSGVVDSTKKADLTVKFGSMPAVTKAVNFGSVSDITKVTVGEAEDAINTAVVGDFQCTYDAATTRLRGGLGKAAKIVVNITNNSGNDLVIPDDVYTLTITAPGKMPETLTYGYFGYPPLADGSSLSITFQSSHVGSIPQIDPNWQGDPLPIIGTTQVVMSPDIAQLATGVDTEIGLITQGSIPSYEVNGVIQVTGPLAAALDFGNCIKHGGNGLEIISFFNDETISIGLPKDIKDKEEIDIEGAKGTITRMVIGAMVQGLSPVVTLKNKDYYLLEMIQGGYLDRETGTYNPPRSSESDHPAVWAEVFSAIYSEGSNKLSDVAGYERLFLRNMMGMEGDVPIEAKSWATYAFNMTAVEYRDENGNSFPAWEEQTLSLEQFDALNVRGV